MYEVGQILHRMSFNLKEPFSMSFCSLKHVHWFLSHASFMPPLPRAPVPLSHSTTLHLSLLLSSSHCATSLTRISLTSSVSKLRFEAPTNVTSHLRLCRATAARHRSSSSSDAGWNSVGYGTPISGFRWNLRSNTKFVTFVISRWRSSEFPHFTVPPSSGSRLKSHAIRPNDMKCRFVHPPDPLSPPSSCRCRHTSFPLNHPIRRCVISSRTLR